MIPDDDMYQPPNDLWVDLILLLIFLGVFITLIHFLT